MAVALGGTRQVASYSSIITGPSMPSVILVRSIMRDSCQPSAGPKYALRACSSGEVLDSEFNFSGTLSLSGIPCATSSILTSSTGSSGP